MLLKKRLITLTVFLMIICIVTIIILYFNKESSSNFSEEKFEDLSWVKNFSDISNIFADSGFKKKSSQERERIIEDAVKQMQENLGFTKYSINMSRPANVWIKYENGVSNVYQFEPFDQNEN